MRAKATTSEEKFPAAENLKRSVYFVSRKIARCVPDSVVAFADVVAVAGLLGFNSIPMAGRLPPTGDAIDARIHQIFLRPTFGDHFDRHPGVPRPSQFADDAGESLAPALMSLHFHFGLIVGMPRGFGEQDGVFLASCAGRMLGMNPHGENHAPLRQRTFRQVDQCIQMARSEAVVFAGRKRQER